MDGLWVGLGKHIAAFSVRTRVRPAAAAGRRANVGSEHTAAAARQDRSRGRRREGRWRRSHARAAAAAAAGPHACVPAWPRREHEHGCKRQGHSMTGVTVERWAAGKPSPGNPEY